MLIYYLVKKNQTHVTFRKLTQLEYIVLTKKKKSYQKCTCVLLYKQKLARKTGRCESRRLFGKGEKSNMRRREEEEG